MEVNEVKISVSGTYIEALKDARQLIEELRRQWLITAEEKKYRDKFSLGMFVGYDTSIGLINILIRDPGEHYLGES